MASSMTDHDGGIVAVSRVLPIDEVRPGTGVLSEWRTTSRSAGWTNLRDAAREFRAPTDDEKQAWLDRVYGWAFGFHPDELADAFAR